MSLTERKEKFLDILITSLWAFLAWTIWSIFIFIIAFFLWKYINFLPAAQVNNSFVVQNMTPYPIILSLITLVWTTITSFITYIILWATNPEKYRKNLVIFSQIAFFQILVYIFLLPVYFTYWAIKYDNIILIYIFHIFTIIFWTNIILDILNNYRYILISIYWNFIWLFISILIALWIVNIFSNWNAKLIILVFLLPIINFFIIFIKKIFEFVYFHYYRLTWNDPIWDIFYKIKKEDEEREKEEEQKNML